MNVVRLGLLCFGFGGVLLIWSLVSVEVPFGLNLIGLKLLSGFFAFILLGSGFYFMLVSALNNVKTKQRPS
jgi:hypothetical protein